MPTTEHIKITPSRELTNPKQIAKKIGGLWHIVNEADGLLESVVSGDTRPTFEFFIYSAGKDNAISFYMDVTDDTHLETVETALEQAYPDSFDIERVEVDKEDMLIPQFQFSNKDAYLETFGEQIDDWNAVDFTETVETDAIVDPADHDLVVAPDNDLDLPGDPVVVHEESDGEFEQQVLAKPGVDEVDPLIIEWQGKGDRRDDWMTTIQMFTDIMEGADEENPVRSPLAGIIRYMGKLDVPCGFQVLFQAKPDWKKKAQERKKDLHKARDTWKQKIMYEVGEVVHESTRESRREKRRGPPTTEGEDAANDEGTGMGSAGQRKQLIDDKHPDLTFHTNIRFCAIATRSRPVDELKQTMENVRQELNDVGGKYYALEDVLVENSEGYVMGSNAATNLLRSIINQEIIIDTRGKQRRSLVLNPAELANFIVVPNPYSLTIAGVRGTRAKPESRNPLPRPDPDLMEQFHDDGMKVGYALDELSRREDEPTEVPPELLPYHYARFATTGAGKSKGILNDMLSLNENTEGPTILVDPKGDGMCENLIRCFWARHKDDPEKLQNIHYFPIPEVLPGFSFFDIRNEIDEDGLDKDRTQAVQRKAKGYEEILKLVMTDGKYGDSIVAPTIIESLIKALFDEEVGQTNGHNRESPDYFSHEDLEVVAKDLQRAATDAVDGGRMPKTTDRRLYGTLERHMYSTDSDFSQIMDAVFNRLDKITQNDYLRQIFDNTDQQFDFADHLDENSIILFNLGQLRDEPSRLMTGLILKELWDTMNDAANQGVTDDWPDDKMVNIIIDEASSVAVSDLMSKMLEKGRGFRLSVGLAMQFPKQMEKEDQHAYLNVMNNVGTYLLGKIPKDNEMAEAIAHEDKEPEEIRNRFQSMPRGEWIGQFPSPEFGQTGPEPFTLEPMPIPEGHADHDDPDKRLSKPDEATFQEAILPNIQDETEEEYGIPEDEDEDADLDNKAWGGEASADGRDDPSPDAASAGGGDGDVPDGAQHGEGEGGFQPPSSALSTDAGEQQHSGEQGGTQTASASGGGIMGPTGDGIDTGDTATTGASANGSEAESGSSAAGADNETAAGGFGEEPGVEGFDDDIIETDDSRFGTDYSEASIGNGDTTADDKQAATDSTPASQPETEASSNGSQPEADSPPTESITETTAEAAGGTLDAFTTGDEGGDTDDAGVENAFAPSDSEGDSADGHGSGTAEPATGQTPEQAGSPDTAGGQRAGNTATETSGSNMSADTSAGTPADPDHTGDGAPSSADSRQQSEQASTPADSRSESADTAGHSNPVADASDTAPPGPTEPGSLDMPPDAVEESPADTQSEPASGNGSGPDTEASTTGPDSQSSESTDPLSGDEPSAGQQPTAERPSPGDASERGDTATPLGIGTDREVVADHVDDNIIVTAETAETAIDPEIGTLSITPNPDSDSSAGDDGSDDDGGPSDGPNETSETSDSNSTGETGDSAPVADRDEGTPDSNTGGQPGPQTGSQSQSSSDDPFSNTVLGSGANGGGGMTPPSDEPMGGDGEETSESAPNATSRGPETSSNSPDPVPERQSDEVTETAGTEAADSPDSDSGGGVGAGTGSSAGSGSAPTQAADTSVSAESAEDAGHDAAPAESAETAPDEGMESPFDPDDSVPEPHRESGPETGGNVEASSETGSDTDTGSDSGSDSDDLPADVRGDPTRQTLREAKRQKRKEAREDPDVNWPPSSDTPDFDPEDIEVPDPQPDRVEDDDDADDTIDPADRDFEPPLAEALPESYSPTYLTEGNVGHRRHGLDDPEATVLRTIVDSYNGYNDYPLELPMNRHITGKFSSVSVTELEERGFLERHNLGKRGAWFTPTKRAQKAVGRTLRAGANKGDRGEAMPHRVGTYIIKTYLEQLPEVRSVALYEAVGDDGERIDAVAYDADIDPIHTVEVEAGELTADGDTQTWGTNNGQSIVHDFQKLVEMGGDSWWIVRNRRVADQILTHLRREGCLDVDRVVSGQIERKRRQVSDLDAEGIDHLFTIQEIWDALEQGVYIHD